jgi:hypothetical protein
MGMTILDYLLLAAFLAAMIYTTGRLFMGWRYSGSSNASADTAEAETGAPAARIANIATRAPWHNEPQSARRDQ